MKLQLDLSNICHGGCSMYICHKIYFFSIFLSLDQFYAIDARVSQPKKTWFCILYIKVGDYIELSCILLQYITIAAAW